MGFLRRVGLLPVIFDVGYEEFTANTIRYLGDVLDDPKTIIQAARNLIHLANSATGAALDNEKVRDAANIPAPAGRPRYAKTLGVPIPVGDFLNRDFGVAMRRDQSASQGIVERALDLVRAGPADVELTGYVGLSGMGGVGKTALATELCHRLAAVEDWARDHPGGVLWIAAGFEHASDRSDGEKSFRTDERHILLRLGRLIGVEPDANAEDPDNAALAGGLRDGLRLRGGGLLVLDNLEDPMILASFRSLLPSGWQLLVTSRRKDLEGFEERNRIPLDCYTRDEAIEYFSQPGVLGQLTDSEREAVQRLHEVSGGLPLVCSVVAESVKWGADTLETAVDRVASESADLMTTQVPAHLAQVLGRTGAEELDPRSVATVYASMKQGLAAVRRGPYGETVEKLFAALVPFDPLTGGPVTLILRSAEVEDLPEARPALENLIRANLIENRPALPLPGLPEPERRFGLHPVIRLMAEEEFKDRRDELESSWILSLITRAEEGGRLFGERTQTGIDLLRMEAANVKLLIERCLLAGSRPEQISRLSALAVAWCHQLINLTWPVKEVAPIFRAAVGRLESSIHRQECAWLIKVLGDLARRTADLAGARERYDAALPLYREIEDRLGEANTLKALGDLARRTADLSGARERYESALPLYREIEARLGEANTLKALGDLALRTDDLSGARDRYDAALPLYREIENRLGEANTLKALGDLALRTADLVGARDRYDAALPLYREIEARLGEANTLQSLAQLAIHDDAVWAVRVIRSVREIYVEIENRLGEQACLGYEARFWMAAEKPAHSLWATETALTLGKGTSDLFGEKLTLDTQADAFNGLKNAPGVLACWYRGLEICRQIDDPQTREYEERWRNLRENEDQEEGLKELIRLIENDAEGVRQAAYKHSSEHIGEEEKKAYESLKPATMQEVDEWLKTGKTPEG